MRTFHIAISALAFVLALPAAASADRTSTSNNLKQMTLGAHAAGVEGQKQLRCQAARSSAARMQCSNNLKQLGMALHNSRVDALIRLRTTPSEKCARIEYAYGCLSTDPWKLTRVYCRAGSTEASCCKGVRAQVTNICGPAWDAAKKSGEFWSPGPFICKCIQKATDRRLRRMPKRKLKRVPR